MIPHIKAVKNHKYYKGQAILPLVNYLQKMAPLSPVMMDANACKACRSNTEKQISSDAIKSNQCFSCCNGNKEEYVGMIGSGKTVDTEECT